MVATYIAHRSAKLALMALYIIYEHREVKKKKKTEKRSGPFFSLLKTWKTEKLRPKRRSWQVWNNESYHVRNKLQPYNRIAR